MMSSKLVNNFSSIVGFSNQLSAFLYLSTIDTKSLTDVSGNCFIITEEIVLASFSLQYLSPLSIALVNLLSKSLLFSK